MVAAVTSASCGSDGSGADDASHGGSAGSGGASANEGGASDHEGGADTSGAGAASSAAGTGGASDATTAGAGGDATAGAGAGAGFGVLEISSNALSFSVECPHAPIADPQTVTLTNSGESSLTWSASFDASAVAVTPATSTLDPGAHVDVTVAPAAITSSKAPGSNVPLAPITISSDVAGAAPQTISLSETASGNFVGAVAPISFGRVVVATETTKSVGPLSGGLSLGLTSSDSNFVLSALAPKADGTWDLTFIPTGEGLDSATLTISSQTNCIWPPNTISVSGTGVFDPTCTLIPDGTACAADGLCTLGKCALQAVLDAQPVSALSLLPFTGVVATGTFSAASTASLAATIDWGDGATTVGTVTNLAGVLGVSGSHTYAHAGTFSGVVTLLDVDSGLSIRANFGASVT